MGDIEDLSQSAMWFIGHDDDVLHNTNVKRRKRSPNIARAPASFDPDAESTQPADSKAGVLAILLGRAGADEAVIKKILRATPGEGVAFAFAIDRHRALAEAVGLPLHTVGFGFQYLSEGELPEGIATERILKT